MNDHLSTDQRQLELATSRKLPESVVLDPTTVAQRKAWLATGFAAEAAGRDGLNQEALLASLRNELIPSVQPVQTPAQTPFDWSWGAVGLAAVLLIGATVIGSLSYRLPETMPREAKLPDSRASQLARGNNPGNFQRGSRDGRGNADSVALTPQSPSFISRANSWDDIEGHIQSTYTAIQALDVQPRGVDYSLTEFENQLKQFSADLAADSL